MLTIFIILFIYACIQDWRIKRKKKTLVSFVPMMFYITYENYVWYVIGFILAVFIVSAIIVCITLRDPKPPKRTEGAHGAYSET